MRWLLLSLSICAFFSALGNSSGNFYDARGDSLPRPNIILIIAESHRSEAIAGSGNSFIQTPNLKRLASEGVKFNNFYVTTAICCVSRASIMSGQYGHTHGINDFSTDFTKAAFSKTLPMQMRDAGYNLSWVGFFGVGKNPPKEDFYYWKAKIPWESNGLHNTDLTVESVNNFLDNYKSKVPFFMCVNFDAAHEIDPTPSAPAHYLVQDRFKNLYSDIDIPEPKTADPQYWSEFPVFFRDRRNIGRKRWYGFFSTKALLQKSTKDYYRLITGLDDAVGRIRNELVKEGLDKNTIIVYTSDHGVSLGEHGLMGKWYPYDVSMHVPFILYDPRSTALSGKESDAFALNIDIAPTLLGLVGLNAPSEMEGENLIDLIKGKIKPRDYFLSEYSVFGAPQLFETKAIVSKQFRYIKYTEYGYEQLFDIVKDPEESSNLVKDPKYLDTLQNMRDLYRRLTTR